MTARQAAFRQFVAKDPAIARLVRECEVPQREASDPAWMARFLAHVAEDDPAFRRSPSYEAAAEHAHAAAAERDLQNRVAAAYWDPKLRAQYGTEAIERAWSDPATARELLLKESATGRLTPSADAALRAIYDVEHFVSEQGGALPEPAAKPIPAGADAQEAEYQELISKSATGKLTGTEDARLQALAEAKVARHTQQEAAAEAAGGRKPAPSEYDTLIQKSVSAGLSAAESARMTALAGDRAVAAGLITEDDLEVEQQQEAGE